MGFVKMKKEEQIESLLNAEIKKIIAGNVWDKSRIASWIEAILKATGDLLDKYLKNGVYKYCIDVNVLKSTAMARQSETLKSSTDYSFNLKVKNGKGLIVVVNCHAFKIG